MRAVPVLQLGLVRFLVLCVPSRLKERDRRIHHDNPVRVLGDATIVLLLLVYRKIRVLKVHIGVHHRYGIYEALRVQRQGNGHVWNILLQLLDGIANNRLPGELIRYELEYCAIHLLALRELHHGNPRVEAWVQHVHLVYVVSCLLGNNPNYIGQYGHHLHRLLE